MPSVGSKQHKLMEIAAHTKGGAGGVPESVGKEFVAADEGKKQPVSHKERRRAIYKHPRSRRGDE